MSAVTCPCPTPSFILYSTLATLFLNFRLFSHPLRNTAFHSPLLLYSTTTPHTSPPLSFTSYSPPSTSINFRTISATVLSSQTSIIARMFVRSPSYFSNNDLVYKPSNSTTFPHYTNHIRPLLLKQQATNTAQYKLMDCTNLHSF